MVWRPKGEGDFDIKNKSSREQRRMKRKWRNQKRNEREQKKKKETLENILAINNPPQSPNKQDNRELPTPIQSVRGRKKVKSNRTAVYRELLATRRELRKKERGIHVEKYRKRLQHSKDRIPLNNESTKSKIISNYAEAVMNKRSSNSRKEKKRAIILTHLLTDNIKQNIKQNQNDRDKHRVFQLRFLQRYRLVNCFSSLTGIPRYKLKKNPNILGNKHTKRSRSEKCLQERKPLIRRFLEQDVNSTMTPGKKDTITRGGVKKQKRFLNNTLKNLYNKFLEENPNGFISYCSFCRYKPFWIVEKKISERNTCLCKVHENVKFMINKLHELKTLDKVCDLITCDQ